MNVEICPLCFPTGYRDNDLKVFVWDQTHPTIHLRRSLYSEWNERRCDWQAKDYEKLRADFFRQT